MLLGIILLLALVAGVFIAILIRLDSPKKKSKVDDWIVSWLAMSRGVKAETLNRDTMISNEEVYGAVIAATFYYGAVLLIDNFDEISTVGKFADSVGEQIDQQKKARSP